MKRRTEDAIQIFQLAVASVHPARLLPANLHVSETDIFISDHQIPRHSAQHIYVIGAGKASAAMAIETEKILGSLITDGLVITKYGHRLPTRRIRILEAAHTVPDERSVKGVRETVQLLSKATEKDIVICMISVGDCESLWDLL